MVCLQVAAIATPSETLAGVFCTTYTGDNGLHNSQKHQNLDLHFVWSFHTVDTEVAPLGNFKKDYHLLQDNLFLTVLLPYEGELPLSCLSSLSLLCRCLLLFSAHILIFLTSVSYDNKDK